MRFIAYGLDQMQNGRELVQHYRLVLLSQHVHNLFALSNGSQRLIDDADHLQRPGGRVQLSKAAVDQHQSRHFRLFLLQTRVAAGDHFVHGREIIIAFHRADDELAVIAPLHPSVLPDHHAGDLVGSLYVGDIKTFDSPRRLFQTECLPQGFLNCFRVGLENAEAGVETVFRVGLGQIQHGALLPPLRRVDLHLSVALFRQQFFHHLAVFELHRNMDHAGHVLLIEINLQKQGRDERGSFELRLVFPEEIAAVHDMAIAQVEKIDRHQRRLGIHAEDVHVVARGRGHLLAFVQFLHGGQQVAQRAGFLEARLVGSGLNSLAQFSRQYAVFAFQKKPHLANALRIIFRRSQAFHTRANTAVDVELQAGFGMVAGQIYLARGDQEMAVDEIDRAMREVGGEVRAEIGGAVFADAAGDEDPRKSFTGELDGRVTLVVPEQNVVTWLVLFDEIVLQRQGFFFVVEQNVVDVARFGNQGAGLDVSQPVVIEIAADPGAQPLGLTYVNDAAIRVFVQVHAWPERQLGCFFAEGLQGGFPEGQYN